LDAIQAFVININAYDLNDALLGGRVKQQAGINHAYGCNNIHVASVMLAESVA
jgi:hypothetical protein